MKNRTDQLRIPVEKIPDEGLDVSRFLSSLIFTSEDLHGVFKEEISVQLHCEKTTQMVLVSGSISTSAHLECSRCLKKVTIEIEISPVSYQKEFKCSDEVIDLTSDIREDIIVALPIKALCRKDCRGLCPRCGRDLNKETCSCTSEKKSSWQAQLDNIKKDLQH